MPHQPVPNVVARMQDVDSRFHVARLRAVGSAIPEDLPHLRWCGVEVDGKVVTLHERSVRCCPMSDHGEWQFAMRSEEFEQAVADFVWDEGFVAEVSIVSPSQLLPNGFVKFPAATPDARIVMVTPHPPHHGLDVHVHLAEEVQIRGGSSLAPRVHVGRTDVELVIGPDSGRVRGRALRFRVLSRSAAAATQLGRTYPGEADFDDDRFWRPR